MPLSLEEANRVIAGTIAKAKELNIKVCISVCDAGGRLIAFNRMDGAIWGASFGAQGKAMASAAFGRSTGEMQDRAESVIIRGIVATEGNHLIVHQGAVPIMRNGVLEGACGVGGATAQQDEDCARAGVEQLTEK